MKLFSGGSVINKATPPNFIKCRERLEEEEGEDKKKNLDDINFFLEMEDISLKCKFRKKIRPQK